MEVAYSMCDARHPTNQAQTGTVSKSGRLKPDPDPKLGVQNEDLEIGGGAPLTICFGPPLLPFIVLVVPFGSPKRRKSRSKIGIKFGARFGRVQGQQESVLGGLRGRDGRLQGGHESPRPSFL